MKANEIELVTEIYLLMKIILIQIEYCNTSIFFLIRLYYRICDIAM